ncbi:ATP-NAD kinase-like domain-containing protein [Rhodocollybia butyracea]|uniref:ATP-NAD kinase-like domain-containing protein n=1 Tax=Rhodocollybia butyracea TaxID=206335 RepID=A0A9P5Q607_9AGAR|nr:ATP-NAD kinase-like domain-containing protein [Rhodocollybia butyracea]
MADIDTLAVVQGKSTRYCLSSTALTVTIGSKNSQTIPLHNIVATSFNAQSQTLNISYATRKKKKAPLVLEHLSGHVEESQVESASKLANTTLQWAYKGIKPNRRLKVLINPHGGVGKGVSLFNNLVKPVLKTAGCSLDIVQTKKAGDAYDIAKSFPLDEFDAILTVSGDGLIHEVLNGFANHAHPRKAFRIPVSPIPTGSGNGLSLNLLGIEDGFDVVAAALNAIKGSPMHVDVFSVTQSGKRTISFMSQALGLMADLDVGTDNLRWMGSSRFTYGLLRGLIRFKACQVQLSYKGVETDKKKMFDTLKSRHYQDPSVLDLQEDEPDDSSLPERQYSFDDTEGWTTFQEPLLYLYAGKGPYVARDFMAFPVSLPDDGLIDVVAQTNRNLSRTDVLTSFGRAQRGELYWDDSCSYLKVRAYRIKPLSQKGCLAFDGEPFPFEEFQVEVLPKLATLLSPHGFYNAPFNEPAASKR